MEGDGSLTDRWAHSSRHNAIFGKDNDVDSLGMTEVSPSSGSSGDRRNLSTARYRHNDIVMAETLPCKQGDG